MMEKEIYGLAMEGRELKKQKAGRIPKWDTAPFWDETYPLNLVREVLGHVTEYRLEENLRPERYPLEKREYIFSLAPELGGNGSPSISSEQISILMVEFALSRDMADSMDRALESMLPYHRDILEMRYRDGMTFSSIGEKLSASVKLKKRSAANIRKICRELVCKMTWEDRLCYILNGVHLETACREREKQEREALQRQREQQKKAGVHKRWFQKKKTVNTRMLSYPSNLVVELLWNGTGDAWDSGRLKVYREKVGRVPETICLTKDHISGLEHMLDNLSPKEKRAILLRFRDHMTYEKVGAEFGLSKERVRQITAKALRKMRHCVSYGFDEEKIRQGEQENV